MEAQLAHFTYLGVLAFCLLGTGWLELLLRTRVYRRALRLLAAIVPVLIIFTAWDVYAISRNHWSFDSRFITGISVIGHVPLDEVCFFIVIPVCAILTLEAVRSARGWTVGDERVTRTSEDTQ